jgi:hypothetical protein
VDHKVMLTRLHTEEWIGAGAPVGAFSSGPSLNAARANIGGVGTSTAALGFGGRAPVNSSEMNNIMEQLGQRLEI